MRISDWSSDVCSSDLLAVRLIPQQEADLVVKRVHRLLAVAPRGHAVVKPPQHLLPVFLHRNRLEAGLFEIGRLGRPVVLVMVRQIDPGIAFPFADKRRQRTQFSRIGNFVRHNSSPSCCWDATLTPARPRWLIAPLNASNRPNQKTEKSS